ncbi:MAG: hypothetical protein KF743_01605 [Fimbriimonadaceae bacterium]|nr:hypothetical protein [Fimbriimonadaceae bacterium]
MTRLFTASSVVPIVAVLPRTVAAAPVVTVLPRTVAAAPVVAVLPRTVAAAPVVTVLPRPIPATPVVAVLPRPVAATPIVAVLPRPVAAAPVVAVLPRPVAAAPVVAILPRPVAATPVVAILPRPIAAFPVVAVLPRPVAVISVVTVLPRPVAAFPAVAVLPRPVAVISVVAVLPRPVATTPVVAILIGTRPSVAIELFLERPIRSPVILVEFKLAELEVPEFDRDCHVGVTQVDDGFPNHIQAILVSVGADAFSRDRNGIHEQLLELLGEPNKGERLHFGDGNLGGKHPVRNPWPVDPALLGGECFFNQFAELGEPLGTFFFADGAGLQDEPSAVGVEIFWVALVGPLAHHIPLWGFAHYDPATATPPSGLGTTAANGPSSQQHICPAR